jgi:type I restriction enzyme S subunit
MYRKCTISEIGEIVSGATPKTSISANFGGEIPWLTPADLSGYREKYISRGARNLTQQGYDSCSTQLMPAGTVLLSSRAPIGYVAIAKNDICTNQGFKSIVPKEGVDSEFLYYQLKYLKNILQDLGSGTTFKELSAKKLGTVQVVVPPIEEQRCIVSKIEELFSKLDACVAELQTAKEKLKVYRQAVLKEAFNEHVQYHKLEDLCFFITKGTTPSKKELSPTGEIPFIKVYNLTFNTTLDFSIEPTYISGAVHTGQLVRSIVLPGDVLMNIVGPPMGKVSIVPNTFPEWNINQAIVRFRCKASLNNKYLAHYLCYAQTVENMKLKSKATAGQCNLTLEICRNVEIPVPTVEKQLQIVFDIESQLSVCDSIEQSIDTSLRQAEALRQSILKQAFEGRLN